MSNARNLSKLIPNSSGLIANANIDASAAIAQSKLAAITSSNLPAGSVIQVKGDVHTSAVNIETVSTTPIGTDLGIPLASGIVILIVIINKHIVVCLFRQKV